MFLSFGKKTPSSKKLMDSPNTTSPSRVSSTSNSNAASADARGRGARATVQTVAGPLLASTRFNSTLDASTYANVNSPGFTSRVVHCASTGSPSHHGSTATHQNKYSSIGLFPRVQLGKHSILPTLSPRISQKVSRTPVRVRIAAPSFSERRRYSTPDGSTVEVKDRIDVLKKSPSHTGHTSNKGHSSPPRVTYSSNGLPEGIAETSRKRIFSECQDGWDEAKKRRKKAEIPIPNPNDDMYQYRHVRAPAVPSSLPYSDISYQGKRAREKGSPEEQKRQRRKICNTNNAIFSSLSSSRNLMERLYTPKRKSADMSRSSSPLTPLGGKHVKENKMVTSAKGVQCNLDEDTCQANLTETRHQDSTPLSTKGIVKRSVESNVCEKVRSSSDSQQVPVCDYTTKLFRKKVANSPRTPASKERKQSLWVQPPEADELSCSLLNGDSKLDRPDRLKSLLACVSGKEKTPVENQTTANVPATIEVTKATIQNTFGFLSPTSVISVPTSPVLSPSSAVTVTVSSTCTIMTSATVTSVNGVPSSESSPPSLSSPSPPQSLQAPTSSSIVLPSSGFKLTDSSPQPSLFGPSPMKGSVTSPVQVSLSSTVMTKKVSSTSAPSLGCTASTSVSLHTSNVTTSSGSFRMQSKESPTVASSLNLPTFASIQSDSGKNQTTSNQSDPNTASQPSLSLFTMKSPIQSSSILGSSTAPSADTFKPSSQFGSSKSNIPSTTKPSFQFGTGDGNVSITTKSSLQFVSSNPVSSSVEKTQSPTQSAFQLVSAVKSSEKSNSAKPSNTTSAFSQPQFGSNASTVPNPAFSFPPSGNAPLAAKPVLQFGSSSNVGETQKPPFQFSTNVGSLNEGSKATMNFASNGGNAATQSKTFSFGSNQSGTSESSKAAFQFGSSNTSGSEVSKPSLSFGSASIISGASKPAFQFGSSSSETSGASKPAFQFGLGSNGTSGAPKPSFQFNPNPAANSSKPAFQSASNLDKSNDTLKPSFQFSANTIEKSHSFPTPTFGSPLQSSSSAFGQVAPHQSKSSFTFGSSASASPSIGASSGNERKGGFSFGSSGPSFGSTNSATSVNFGNSSPFAPLSAPAFGSSASNAHSPPSSFVSAIEPKTNGFAAPAFGSSAPNAQSPPLAFGSVTEPKPNGFGSTTGFGVSASFSFTSNSSSESAFQFSDKLSAGSTSGSFAFGQNPDQTPSAFSFNGTVPAVPNGSAPISQPTGLFSMGAGPSSSQRRIARRKR